MPTNKEKRKVNQHDHSHMAGTDFTLERSLGNRVTALETGLESVKATVTQGFADISSALQTLSKNVAHLQQDQAKTGMVSWQMILAVAAIIIPSIAVIITVASLVLLPLYKEINRHDKMLSENILWHNQIDTDRWTNEDHMYYHENTILPLDATVDDLHSRVTVLEELQRHLEHDVDRHLYRNDHPVRQTLLIEEHLRDHKQGHKE